MRNKLLKGFFLGIISPIAAFIVYVAFMTDIADPIAIYNQIVSLGVLAHVISLCVLINLVIFFMNIKLNSDNVARGILLATLFYGITIAVIKIF